ncbi:helix-turn-helix domain-containing protein [Micromonospora sp. NBC_00421]|uniref:helix-turn-helix domain-containing protein n=1 Tax=Micromonospora sp. NBC_00421 TaxID=2975976 RepID=UPI002E20A10F
MSLLRRVIGGVLRRVRLRQGRTLREVATAAGVSLPYLSEVERGRKEASSEVLAAICRALGIHLSDLLEEARDELRRVERRVPVPPGGTLAGPGRVPTARRAGTGPHLQVGRPTAGFGRPTAAVGPSRANSGPSTVRAGGPTGFAPMFHVGGAGFRSSGAGFRSGGGAPAPVGGASGFAVVAGVAPVRVPAVLSTARPAARTARMLARRRARTGRRRLLVG